MKIDKEARDKIIERLNECDELGGYTVETAKVLSHLEDFINSIPVDDSHAKIAELEKINTYLEQQYTNNKTTKQKLEANQIKGRCKDCHWYIRDNEPCEEIEVELGKDGYCSEFEQKADQFLKDCKEE